MELLTRLEEAILFAVLRLGDDAHGVSINPDFAFPIIGIEPFHSCRRISAGFVLADRADCQATVRQAKANTVRAGTTNIPTPRANISSPEKDDFPRHGGEFVCFRDNRCSNTDIGFARGAGRRSFFGSAL